MKYRMGWWQCSVILSWLWAGCAGAAKWDWVEGDGAKNDGATRDYYNRVAGLKWKVPGGDWVDGEGVVQGGVAFGRVRAEAGKEVEVDLTGLVKGWVSGGLVNQGVLVRVMDGNGLVEMGSREGGGGAVLWVNGKEIGVGEDSYLDPSTYRCVGGAAEKLRVGRGMVGLMRFDLEGVKEVGEAVLQVKVGKVYGEGELGVFAVACGEGEVVMEERVGIAAGYVGDEGIERDRRVIFATGFEEVDWAERWSEVGVKGQVEVVREDGERRFEALRGKALRVRMKEGRNGALNTLYQFGREVGEEPEEVYFRYYLRLGEDWNQTVGGGKMPGISGTYGVAGWGGRPSHGADGWSARGQFFRTVPAGNPLGGLHPIGTYCYHADMEGQYGESWLWGKGYLGFLQKNRWVCVEQSVRLNTPGENDGVIRGWVDGGLAFERTDLKFRTTEKLKIEQVWMNVYHGGKAASPYDQHLFIDHVVIARDYIGPLESGG